MSDAAADDGRMAAMLRAHRRIAVVGLSPNPGRPSHGVSAYMQAAGYRITPVNPCGGEILGEPCVPDLAAAAELGPLEIVNVFRRPEAVPEVVAAAIAHGAAVIWMQRGVVHEAAAERAGRAGIEVVMDRCIKVEHARLIGRAAA